MRTAVLFGSSCTFGDRTYTDYYCLSNRAIFIQDINLYDRLIVYDDVTPIFEPETFAFILKHIKHLEIKYYYIGNIRSLQSESFILTSVLQSNLLSFKWTHLTGYDELISLMELYKVNYRINLDLNFNSFGTYTSSFRLRFIHQCDLYKIRNSEGFDRMIASCRAWMSCWKFGKCCVSSLPRDIALLIGRKVWSSRYEQRWYDPHWYGPYWYVSTKAEEEKLRLKLNAENQINQTNPTNEKPKRRRKRNRRTKKKMEMK